MSCLAKFICIFIITICLQGYLADPDPNGDVVVMTNRGWVLVNPSGCTSAVVTTTKNVTQTETVTATSIVTIMETSTQTVTQFPSTCSSATLGGWYKQPVEEDVVNDLSDPVVEPSAEYKLAY